MLKQSEISFLRAFISKALDYNEEFYVQISDSIYTLTALTRNFEKLDEAIGTSKTTIVRVYRRTGAHSYSRIGAVLLEQGEELRHTNVNLMNELIANTRKELEK